LARLVIAGGLGHWPESLVGQLAATQWVATPISGDPDVDAAAILGAVERSGVRADGVLTFWENCVCEAARVAAALGCRTTHLRRSTRRPARSAPGAVRAWLGLPTPTAQRVRFLDEVYAAAYRGFPAVVKPEFGTSAAGCVRVDSFELLPGVYKLIRAVVASEQD
jgi:carnosine synthase